MKIKPTRGHNDSEFNPLEAEYRADFRDNRGQREPFVNACGVMIDERNYADLDDDEYFPVPEVLDEP